MSRPRVHHDILIRQVFFLFRFHQRLTWLRFHLRNCAQNRAQVNELFYMIFILFVPGEIK